MSEVALSKIKGDTWRFPVALTRNSVSIDITGYIIFFTVKKYVEHTDAEAVITKEITEHSDPTNGITAIDLLPTETDIDSGDYVYDIQVKTTADKIYTPVYGVLTIIADKTLRII